MSKITDLNVLLVYKNFASNQNISHIGLGVSSLNTAKVLKSHGIKVAVKAITGSQQIADAINADPTITHCIIAAPWIPTIELAGLTWQFLTTEFLVNVHSNVGFLYADTRGIELIREYIALEQGSLNFRVSANSRKGAIWVRQAYECPCTWLPNLYYLDHSTKPQRPLWNGGALHIGAFGATRPLKNLLSDAGAALVIANQLKAQTTFYISGGRHDGGVGVVNAVKAMLNNVPNISVEEIQWTSWPQFRNIVRNMHLMMQVSYTESFNMCTADGVAEGVPSVVSDAIDWVPRYWQAPCDEPTVIARVGRQLLTDPNASMDGFVALQQYNKNAFEDGWCQMLELNVPYAISPSGFVI